MKYSNIAAAILVASLSSAMTYVFYANGENKNHDNHSKHSSISKTQQIPNEVGQGAFASITEIVKILNDDPNTNWETVNIDLLREHLVDMATLTTKAVVVQKNNGNTIEFHVTGTGATIRAIHNMVPAHAIELNKIVNWNTSTSKTIDGVVLILVPETVKEVHRIAALGFFGVMAIGAHHQAHHLAMARGIHHVH